MSLRYRGSPRKSENAGATETGRGVYLTFVVGGLEIFQGLVLVPHECVGFRNLKRGIPALAIESLLGIQQALERPRPASGGEALLSFLDNLEFHWVVRRLRGLACFHQIVLNFLAVEINIGEVQVRRAKRG